MMAKCTISAYRAPCGVPVQTSFGTMRERPMLLVRVEDADGAFGFGEIWCNFPDGALEHRARLLATTLAPLLGRVDMHDPRAAFAELTRLTHVLALQSGEPGPFAQCIAGIELALWDLAARQRGESLWRFLGGTNPAIRVYASGLNPEQPERLAAAKFAEGYRAFKLKVGFTTARDVANLQALRAELGPACSLMADANQAWDLRAATEAVEAFAPFDLEWLEEPLPADAPSSEWRELSARAPIAFAAGENFASALDFREAMEGSSIAVIQPDVAKWGGLSACVPIARAIVASGKRFCPHYLGGGVGLAASAHLLAAIGGDGMLEIDANENVLRTLLLGPLGVVTGGECRLTEAPGIGIDPDNAGLDRHLIHSEQITFAHR